MAQPVSEDRWWASHGTSNFVGCIPLRGSAESHRLPCINTLSKLRISTMGRMASPAVYHGAKRGISTSVRPSGDRCDALRWKRWVSVLVQGEVAEGFNVFPSGRSTRTHQKLTEFVPSGNPLGLVIATAYRAQLQRHPWEARGAYRKSRCIHRTRRVPVKSAFAVPGRARCDADIRGLNAASRAVYHGVGGRGGGLDLFGVHPKRVKSRVSGKT